eukprot:1555302-Rhodomonas_salina.1
MSGSFDWRVHVTWTWTHAHAQFHGMEARVQVQAIASTARAYNYLPFIPVHRCTSPTALVS